MAEFEDFRDLYELGQTPAQIAATLAADPRYKRNTDSGVLMNMIKNTFPVIRKDALGGSGNWEGPLIDAAKALDLADPDPTTAANNNLIYAGLEQLLSNETPTVIVACHDKPLIGQMTTAICQLVGQIVASTDQIEGDADTVKAAVVAQTGGRLYGDVTEAEITEAIAAHEAEQTRLARQAIVDGAIAHFEKIATDLAHARQAAFEAATPAINEAIEHTNNARASMGDEHIAALTDAELTARVDAVIATSDGVLA